MIVRGGALRCTTEVVAMSRVQRDIRPVSAPDRAWTPPGVVPRLVPARALMVFLELPLIRWLGANIVHLSYFTNFVLLGSFLGLGLGFLVAGRGWSFLRWTPLLLALLVVCARVFPVSVD